MYNVYQNGLDDFQNKYTNLLKAGGSNSYKELLKPFNLDPSKPDFWNRGISMIDNFINQLEELK